MRVPVILDDGVNQTTLYLYGDPGMVTKIQQWGNSQGLRVPLAILEQAHLGVGDTVQIVAVGKQLVIESVAPVRGRYKLADLLKKCKGKVPEADWGPPQGKEAW